MGPSLPVCSPSDPEEVSISGKFHQDEGWKSGCLPPRALGSSRGRQNSTVRAGAWSLVNCAEQEGRPGLSLSCSSCSSISCSQSVAAGRCLEQRQGEEESPSLENALQKSWPPPLSPPQRSPPHLHPACSLFTESSDPRHISQLLTVPWARSWMPDKDPDTPLLDFLYL